MSEETRIILVNSVSPSEYITITNDFRKLEEKIKRLHSIIKEVRERLQETINRWEDYEQFYEVVVEDKYILETLDKENKGE